MRLLWASFVAVVAVYWAAATIGYVFMGHDPGRVAIGASLLIAWLLAVSEFIGIIRGDDKP